MVKLIFLTSVVLVSVFAVPSLSQEDDSCHLHTDLNIRERYVYFDIPGDATGIEFKVKDNNAAVIVISSSTYFWINGHYRIVIGEEDDTQSALRYCSGPSIDCTTLADEATDDFLDPEEFRRFWIKFGNKGIEVGRWDDETAFMDFEFDAPMSFEYLGYQKTDSAEFLFCNFVYDSELSSPLPTVTSSSLNVSSSSEAHSPITLSVGEEKLDFVCENNVLNLFCNESETIQIIDALYGYDWRDVEPRIQCVGPISIEEGQLCIASLSKQIISSTCNNKTDCSILASNSVFGDPCYFTFKYLRVTYTCFCGDTSSSSSGSAPTSEVTVINSDESRTTAADDYVQRQSTNDGGITSVMKGTLLLTTHYQDDNNHEDNISGHVALWPLAAVCVIPLVGAVVICVVIRRKKKGTTGQTGELPNSVIEDRPDKISSTFQNETYEYAWNGETRDHSADTAMVDNAAYQAADEFSHNRNDVNLGGESIYNVAYESYGKKE